MQEDHVDPRKGPLLLVAHELLPRRTDVLDIDQAFRRAHQYMKKHGSPQTDREVLAVVAKLLLEDATPSEVSACFEDATLLLFEGGAFSTVAPSGVPATLSAPSYAASSLPASAVSTAALAATSVSTAALATS